MVRMVCVTVTAGVFMMGGAVADLSLAGVFGDSMVLQRGKPVHLWGTAAPGESVTVSMNKKTATAQADATGAWSAQLPAMQAGGPYEMSVSGAAVQLTIKDVLLGDVWICSGQSNMGMTVQDTLRGAQDAEKEIGEADHPDIRLFSVMPTLAAAPQDELASHTAWMPCTPDSVRGFTAAGYYFGRHVHETQKVPVGLVMTAWGGTYAEAWTSREGLATMPEFTERLKETEASLPRLREIEAAYLKIAEAWEGEMDALDDGVVDGVPLWSRPECPAGDWEPVDMPISALKLAGIKPSELGGRVWLRRDIELPVSWQGHDLMVYLGLARETGRVWFNGTEVNRFDLVYRIWDLRTAAIPGSLVRPGVNTLVVRLTDASNMGGLYGDHNTLQIVAEGPGTEPKSINIAGSWLMRRGLDIGQLTPRPSPPAYWPDNPNMPTVLYNAMIHPLVRMPIKGVIWYQGESNAAAAYEYRSLFPALIQDWRRAWGQGDFPFLYVQIANFSAGMPIAGEPRECSWAELREAQLMTLCTPETAMAVSIDIGDPEDIHPLNKKDVGLRLGLAARAVVYGVKVAYSGPIYKSMKTKDGKAHIRFTHAVGLKADGGDLKGFAIAGPDRKFVFARAEVQGNKVVVWSDSVESPVAVRYGWDFAPECNLYNAAGLPVSPFRTDDWPGVTAPKKGS